MRFAKSFSWFVSLSLASLGLVLQASASSEGSFERTLTVSGPVILDVTTGSGNIQVRKGSSNEVLITGHIKVHDWLGDSHDDEKVRRLESNPPIRQEGNNIHIGNIDDPDLRRNVSISYEVIVPSETQLRAHTGSGNATVENIRGPLDLSSGSGNIKASMIGDSSYTQTGSGNIDIDHVKGNVRAKTGSGSIRATGVAGGFESTTGSGDVRLEQTSPGSVRASSGSGTLELLGVRGSLEASAGSGSIRVEGEPRGAWRVHTGSGGVQLRIPGDAAFDLNAHTSSGTVSSNLPVLAETSTSRKELRGRVRGGGVSVEVGTGSGDIEIR